MRSVLIVFLLAFLHFSAFSQDFQEGKVIFKWKNSGESLAKIKQKILPFLKNISSFQIERVFPNHKPLNSENTRMVDLSRIYELRFSRTIPVENVVRQILKSGFVQYAEPKYIHQIFYDPSDPDTGSQYWIERIQARAGWDIMRGDTNVKIGIIDNAIQWNHPDLIGNVAFNYSDPINGLDDDNDGYVDNFHGWDLVGSGAGGNYFPDNEPNSDSSYLHHGTKVTGFAAAATDNLIGIAGVGFHCRFLPIKASGELIGTQIVAGYEGIVYAADQGCAVINCSWGSSSYSFLGQDVVNYATFNKNALVIAAAGNSNNQNKVYPAAFQNVIAVGATNSSDLKGNISSYGIFVDVMAPGTSRTTEFPNTYVFLSENYTSFASPIVAGVAALIKSLNPSFTAEQIGQQLRVTADNIDAINPSFAGLLGSGRVNLFRALTVSSPAVRNLTVFYLDNNNNIPQSGDTLRMTGSFRNYLSPTTNLVVTLSTSDPYLTVSTANVTLGNINTLGVKSNVSPFVIQVAGNAPANYTAVLKLTYTDGLYSDFEYIELVLNPTFANIATNYVQTSLTDDGNFGYVNYPNNTLGIGWLYNGKQNLYEGGILVGRKNTGIVSDNVRLSGSASSQDFISSSGIQIANPGIIANQEASVTYNDDGNTTPLNYRIQQKNWAFASDKFIITQLNIKNNNFFIHDSIFVSVFADFDIGNSNFNRGNYDSTNHIAYTYSAESQYPDYVGVVHLTHNQFNTGCFSRDAYNGVFAFNKSNKLFAMTSGADSASAGLSGQGGDIYQFLNIGPFSLLPLDSVNVSYAVVSGSSFAELQQQAQLAKVRYNCIVNGSSLAVNLGNDIISCGDAELDATTPGAASYLWSNNATTPSITVSGSGTYSVTVFDSSGCSKSDEISVTILPELNPVTYISADTINVTDSLYFGDNTPGATSWNWNFGNGFGSFSRTGSYLYPQEGTYTLTLIVSNGTCSDTIERTIVVLPATSKENAISSQIQVFPNPSKGILNLSASQNLGIFPLQIKNVQGQMIYSTTWNTVQPLKINLQNLSKGLYFIQIENETHKIAIE